MQEERRQRYLQALGIRRWVLRDTPGSAKRTAASPAQPAQEAPTHPTAQPHEPAAQQQPATAQPHEPAAKQQPPITPPSDPAAKRQPPITPPSAHPEPKTAAQSPPTPQKEDPPHLALLFVSCQDLLLVDSLPPQPKASLLSAERRLLSNILHALGRPPQATDMETVLIRWPPEIRSLGRDLQAARSAMQAQAQTRLERSDNIHTVVAMGEDSFRCLAPPDAQTFASARGHLEKHPLLQRNWLVTGSAAACLRDPREKAQLWRELQAAPRGRRSG